MFMEKGKYYLSNGAELDYGCIYKHVGEENGKIVVLDEFGTFGSYYDVREDSLIEISEEDYKSYHDALLQIESAETVEEQYEGFWKIDEIVVKYGLQPLYAEVLEEEKIKEDIRFLKELQ